MYVFCIYALLKYNTKQYNEFVFFSNRDNQPSFAPKAWTIQNHLKQASLPFLRWSALYFHFQSSVPHPVEFEQGKYIFILSFLIADVSSGFGHMLLAHYLWKSDFIGNSTNTDHIVAFSE